MVPYFEQPSVRLGPVTIHAFGVIVAAAVLVGLELARRRFLAVRLDPKVGERMAWRAAVVGFISAHLFALLFYFPHKVAANPLVLFKFWEDISSFGGILGGLLGAAWYLARAAPALPPDRRWAYLDVLAFVFPLALAVGRLACTVAHDHPGTLTRFPLAVSVESAAARDYIAAAYERAGRLAELQAGGRFGGLGFHDLGWYEFLYLVVVVVPVFLLAGRKPRPTGFFVRLFIVLYFPVRFLLDFLRVGDARYWGLTPAQHVALAAMLALAVAWAWPALTSGERRHGGPSPFA